MSDSPSIISRSLSVFFWTGVAGLVAAIVSMVVIGGFRSELSSQLLLQVKAVDRLVAVNFTSSQFEVDNPLRAELLKSQVIQLDNALESFSEAFHEDSEHGEADQAMDRVAFWSEKMLESRSELAVAQYRQGLEWAIKRLEDVITEHTYVLEERANLLQQWFIAAVAVATIAGLSVLYTLTALFLTSLRTARINQAILSGELDEGGAPAPAGLGLLRNFPLTELLAEQTTSIAAELIRQREEQEKLSRKNATLARKNKEALDELLESQEAFKRAERLAAVGRIAGSVSHEINNPVTGVMGYLSYILKKSDHPDVQKYGQKALKEVERIGRIAKSLLVFSRTAPTKEAQPFDVRGTVENVLTLAEVQLHDVGATSRINVSGKIPEAIGRIDHFQQALLNVILNAKDAVAGSEEKVVSVNISSDNKNVVVDVIDSGPGVPEDIQQKIFEAFFTTKAPNKGSGLGLTVAAELMSSMDGRIWFDPSHQPGARFVLEIPVATKS